MSTAGGFQETHPMHYEYLHTATGDPLLPLWRLYKQGHDAACEVVKVPSGFEARVLQDGRFLFSHQFEDSSDVIKWAFDKRVQFRRRGWCQTTVIPPSAREARRDA